MGLKELSDEQWTFIKLFLTLQPITIELELMTVCHRWYFLCIGYRLQIRDKPFCYGAGVTARRRLRRKSKKVMCDEIMDSFQDSAYHKSMFSMDVMCVESRFIETKKGGVDSSYNGRNKRKGIKILHL